MSDGTPSDPHAEYRRQAAQFFGTTSGQADARTEGLMLPVDRRVQFDPAGQPQPNWHRPPVSAAPLSEQPSVRFALQPWHALWALAAVCALAAVFFSSTVGWILLALISAGGGWYARSRNASWPPDVRDLLAHRRLASLGPGTAGPAAAPLAAPPAQAAGGHFRAPVVSTPPPEPASAPIPFRAMTIPELFTGAVKVMLRNWPTLMGIPIAILLAFIVFLYIAIEAIVHFILDTSSALSGGSVLGSGDVSSFVSGMTILMIVFLVVCAAVGLPADALLLALSVIATVRSVHGQPVWLTDTLRQAKPRILAVCRMTLVFYAIALLPDIAVVTVFFFGGLAVYFNGLAYLVFLLCALATFVLSILFSLSPIVLIVEGRGVADSLRRSVSLSKPAYGRIIGIHMLWCVCIIPVVLVTLVLGFNPLVYALAGGALLACFRVVQVLIYTGLRIRQEHYEHQLIEQWTRNTGRRPV